VAGVPYRSFPMKLPVHLQPYVGVASAPQSVWSEFRGPASEGVGASIICPDPPFGWYYCAGGNYYMCCDGSGLANSQADPCQCAGF
jgi:hypothetical protein